MSATGRWKSNLSKRFKTWVGTGSHTGTPVDNDDVEVWQDELTPGGGRDLAFVYGIDPVYCDPGEMVRPSLAFGVLNSFPSVRHFDLFTNTSVSPIGISNLITASAGTIEKAFRLNGDGTNIGTIWQEAAIWADKDGYCGEHVKLVSGQNYLIAYNYDGSEDVTTPIPISKDVDYVSEWRHGSGTLTQTVWSGAGGGTLVDESVSTGNTGSLGGTMRLGRGSGERDLRVFIGEVATDNADLGAASSLAVELIDVWLPAAGGGGQPAMRRWPPGFRPVEVGRSGVHLF